MSSDFRKIFKPLQLELKKNYDYHEIDVNVMVIKSQKH